MQDEESCLNSYLKIQICILVRNFNVTKQNMMTGNVTLIFRTVEKPYFYIRTMLL